MDPFRHKTLDQPDDDQYLWRYIKLKRIQSLLDGDLHFSPLSQFNDNYESISPVFYSLLSFLKRSLSIYNYDLTKHPNELRELNDPEKIWGTFLMRLNLYDMEKKLSMLMGDNDSKEFHETLYDCCINLIPKFGEPHSKYQQQHYASCWFVGDSDESSLMWTSYSEPGGIAVRIKFSEFKKLIKTYFKRNNVENGIKEIYAGLVNYKDFNYTDDWIRDIDRGVPLSFFKQHFYKDEHEFRIVIQRKDNFPDESFKRLNRVFNDTFPFQIILHPTSGLEELTAIREKLKGDKLLKVFLSDMHFNYMGDEIMPFGLVNEDESAPNMFMNYDEDFDDTKPPF